MWAPSGGTSRPFGTTGSGGRTASSSPAGGFRPNNLPTSADAGARTDGGASQRDGSGQRDAGFGVERDGRRDTLTMAISGRDPGSPRRD